MGGEKPSIGSDFTPMHDNAYSQEDKKWLLQENIQVALSWLVQTLDLNPIEHARDILQKILKNLDSLSTTQQLRTY
ncbi:unnamed protein product, partial [Iphiclides podalirius]